jgi:hypothetical protein
VGNVVGTYQMVVTHLEYDQVGSFLVTLYSPPPPAQQPNSGLGRLILEVSRSHTIGHTSGRTPLNE